MCINKNRQVEVKIPEDLSCTGFAKFIYIGIDECISTIVNALQKAGIDMRGSCCGHNKSFGEIHLQDGRMLIIVPDKWYWKIGQKALQKLFNKYEEE